jgi:hypothetical protein
MTRLRLTGTLQERTTARIDRRGDDDCWLWTGGVNKSGYGQVGTGRCVRYAHRVAFEIANKCSLSPSQLILHSCDTPRCCNPAHLRIGTQLDNCRDRESRGRGRQPSGERNGKAKLTTEGVLMIRQSSEPRRVLADRLKVSIAAIDAVRSRAVWAHV